MPAAPLKTFIIYARADAPFKDELLTHLRPFVKNGLLEKWVDSDLLPGEEWEKRIERELEAAHLVIMLVSADALNSDFIEKKELKIALEKKRAGTARVVPILVRDCFWEMHGDLSEIQLLPKDEKGAIRGVAGWISRDTAWTHCLRELKKLVDEIQAALQKEMQAAEAAQQAELLQQQQAAEAEKAARTRRRLDEAAWKKVSEALQVTPDLSQKIILLEAYLHDETHQNHRPEAEELLEDLRADLEAEEKLAKARKKREEEQQEKAREMAEQKRRQEEAERQKELPEMVSVKGGTFNMSDNYQVTLSNYEIGKYPVTQKLWKDIMGNNPSHFKGDDLPVENVRWEDCQAFLKKLNERFPGKNYRLPTEAEWEFAARGGALSKGYEYAGSNDLDEVGWYNKNSGGKTHPVGLKKANELGIHDMSGNVWEWCSDWYGIYPSSAATDPLGPDSGTFRVNRGGSWDDAPQNCRVANRNFNSPGYRNYVLGLRLSRTD
ncbi:MAG: SUMF1/EgtB/PvdO family nonheme iron enzyme [Saprospiraceae bacterium]|nr:SUMF1/EgtB/PvdO family nonheme iron enzyme [Saprospiraceae bacterium]